MADRLEVARGFGAIPVHLTDERPRDAVRQRAGTLDPTALVTHHLPLDEAPDAYAVYDRREALKIVLLP